MDGMGQIRSVWQDRPTLLTGATGLVGYYLAERLARMGASLVCLVRDWLPQSQFVRGGMAGRATIVRGDVRDQQLLERVLGEYEIDTVFHLAAQTIVTIANRNPSFTLDSNIRGTWTLLEACRRSPTIKNIVVASTDKAYGQQEQLPYTESAPLQGRHPYDVSKSCADLIAQSYAHTYGLPVVITRCGNFYGGGDLNWNRIVPGTIRSVLREQRPVIRSDGQHIRDYFYVEDGAEAYLALAEALMDDPSLGGQAFNFSNELQITVVGLVKRILSLMGASLKPLILNEAPNEIPRQFLSAEKARRVLGWEPRYNLKDGLARTIKWYREFFCELKQQPDGASQEQTYPLRTVPQPSSQNQPTLNA